MSLIEKEWYIQVPWGRMCVVAWGDCCNPPVLLCHGLADSATSFRPLIKLMPEKFYFIGIDLPGCGKSDRFPPGLMINIYDLVYAVNAVAKHFRWDAFNLVGHSLGAIIGKLYNLVYPEKLTKLIEIDPINFYAVPPEKFPKWYKRHFVDYYEQYDKLNAPKSKGKVTTVKEAIAVLRKERGFSEDLAVEALKRSAEPAGDGLLRYTDDMRLKYVTTPAFSAEHMKTLFGSTDTQTLIIKAENSYKNGLYRNTGFLLDEKTYPSRNVRVRSVPGDHNVHVTWPRNVAFYMALYLLYGAEGLSSKAKL